MVISSANKVGNPRARVQTTPSMAPGGGNARSNYRLQRGEKDHHVRCEMGIANHSSLKSTASKSHTLTGKSVDRNVRRPSLDAHRPASSIFEALLQIPKRGDRNRIDAWLPPLLTGKVPCRSYWFIKAIASN
jgi:hypothetical protein